MRRTATVHRWTGLVPALILASCVTINLYFPEQEVKDLAEQIEREVQAEAESEASPGDEAPTPDGSAEAGASGGPHSSTGLLDLLLGVTPVQAQGVPEPETTNPAIRKIIESRAGRLAELNRYKSTGVLGEGRRGDVEIRDLAAVADLRARAEVQKLVRAENADRARLYEEIAAAKGIDPSQLDRIRETYAETLRAYARTGDWIQMPDGSWIEKR